MKRIIGLFVVPALVAATLSACSDDSGHDMSGMGMSPRTATPSGPSTPTSGVHNAADVAFATDMIPHHAQAVMMADMVPSRASSQQLKDLAAQIKAAQGPEITQMSGWLQAWGAPVPSTMGMQHGDGMMSMDQMRRLGAASGAAFDTLWMELMIEHHEGAITMSRTELAQGSSPAARALAQAIIEAQTTEIATMNDLLAGS